MPRFTFLGSLTKRVHIRAFQRAQETLGTLSYTGRGLFLFFALMATASSVGLVYLMNQSLVVATPARGGTLTEGIVGSPRFINPILAASDADRDLTSIVYSGLLHAEPDGTYTPDLAESYTTSGDGRVYTFVIRSSATFHNGTPVTADDIAFTVGKIQDPAVHSPLRANWEGVSVSVLDSHTVSFTLKSAYAPFVENLTLGIVPKSLWQGVGSDEFPFSDLNTSPIGSGPYRIGNIARNASGIPTSYTLHSFRNYALGEPYLSTLVLKFYQSETALEDALRGGDIESASGITPASLGSIGGTNIRTVPLNRVFGVFFNQNQSEVLRDVQVRTALSMGIDRRALIENVLGGYGQPIQGPIPPSFDGEDELVHQSLSSSTTDQVAQQYLLSRGWTMESGLLTKKTGSGKNVKTITLTFSLATANVPELRAAAEYLKQEWGKMGAQVNVQVFEQGDLSQNVIRPRKYDSLLFGEVVGRELDLFAFWHSSQRNDPGLNIASYANATVDKALENLRITSDPSKRRELLQQFAAQVESDIPAVFLYSPDFVYSIPNDIAGVDLDYVETPSDRFLSIAGWHREEDYVWPLLIRR